jgi:hypothetical protein
MADSQKIVFQAIILQHEGMDAGYIEFPFSVQEKFGVKGQVKVKAIFDDRVVYLGSLAKMGFRCHALGITKDIRKELNKTFGDKIDVQIEQDLAPREVILPQDVLDLLKQHPDAKEFFYGLSYTNRKEYFTWIDSAKKEETRKQRIEIFIDKLQNHKKLTDKT